MQNPPKKKANKKSEIKTSVKILWTLVAGRICTFYPGTGCSLFWRFWKIALTPGIGKSTGKSRYRNLC